MLYTRFRVEKYFAKSGLPASRLAGLPFNLLKFGHIKFEKNVLPNLADVSIYQTQNYSYSGIMAIVSQCDHVLDM
jgi:hypothetical protein